MIRSLISFLALNTLSVYLITQILDGFVVGGGVLGLVLVGSIIGLLNVFVKPILKVLALPFIFLTLGLFTIVINIAILWFAQQLVVFLAVSDVTFVVDGLVTSIVAALLLGIFNTLLQKLF